MSDTFPEWTNRLPAKVLAGAILVGSGLVAGAWYYVTPKYSRVGYQPIQPTAFSHAVHVDQLGMDCIYCHDGVKSSWYANIPPASSCMNCHNQVLPNDPRLARVRDSVKTGRPIPWVHIHRLPDYVYFSHAVHLNRGVGCLECHGTINRMDQARHVQPMSMSFCLGCHRNPAPRLRPLARVTDLDWSWSDDPEAATVLRRAKGRKLLEVWNVQVLESCATCHR
jgi:hypothetical protein